MRDWIINYYQFSFMKKQKQVPVDTRYKMIGEVLRELRLDKGYTSKEFFAIDAKVARRLYYHLEDGKNMTLKTLFRILDFHGVTAWDFFEMVREKQNQAGKEKK